MASQVFRATVPLGTFSDDGYNFNQHVGEVERWTISHPDSAKRSKPAQLNLSNSTPWYNSRSRKIDAVVTRRAKTVFSSPPVYGTKIELVSEHYPLGGWSDDLEYSTDLEKIVTNKLIATARNRSVNLANMLGEYRQAAGLFVHLVQEVYRITKAVQLRDPRILIYGYLNRKGKFRKGTTGYYWAPKLQRDIAQLWLEYVYGVKPLMKDMHDAMVELKNSTDRSAPYIKLTERASSRRKPKDVVIRSTITGTDTGNLKNWSQRTVKGTAEIWMKNDILNSSLGAYGFTNPLGVLWELSPFSFMVDWWINVGEVIESLDNAIYIDSKRSMMQLSSKYQQSSAVEIMGQGGLFQREVYSRSQAIGFPTVSTLRLKIKPSALHVANGLALARTLLEG